MFEKFKKIFKKKKPFPIELSRRKHKALKKDWDAAQVKARRKVIDLSEAFYATSGNIYYTHNNILDMHVDRNLQLTKALKAIGQGCTDEYLTKNETKILEAAKVKDFNAISLLIHDQKTKRAQNPEIEMILNVAMCLIYKHDESPYYFSHEKQREKLKEIEEDDQLRSFFMSEGWLVTTEFYKGENSRGWSELSLADFLNSHLKAQVMNLSSGQTP